MIAWLIKVMPWALRLSSTGTLATTGKGSIVGLILMSIILFGGYKYTQHKMDERLQEALQQRQIDAVIKASDDEIKNQNQTIKEVEDVKSDFENGDLDSVYDYINGMSDD